MTRIFTEIWINTKRTKTQIFRTDIFDFVHGVTTCFCIISQNMQICGICDTVKDFSAFRKDRKALANGYRSQCKECVNAYSELYHQINWENVMVTVSIQGDIRKNRPFTCEEYIDKPWLAEQQVKQNGCCIYCDVKMVFGRYRSENEPRCDDH